MSEPTPYEAEVDKPASGPLPGWWAKVKRGQEHREALDRYITETFAVEMNRPRIGVKCDADTLEHVLYVNRVPDLTDFYCRVSLIFGDCINNFRTALDYLVYEMGIRNTARTGGLQYPNRIKFPILGKAAGWDGICGKELGEVSSSHQTAIEAFQPYHGRDLQHDGIGLDYHPLAMLRELTDVDKHRLLTAVIVPFGGSVISPGDGIVQTIMLSARWQMIYRGEFGAFPVEFGAEVARAKLPDGTPKDEVDMAGHVYPLVTLADADKRPVLSVIDTLAAMVIKVLRELEPTL